MHALEGRIRHSMEGYLKSEKNSLSMDTLSSKNDRLVLAVKAPHKNEIKGLVHATSASGQTFFIEPESVVVMNNELNELKSQELDVSNTTIQDSILIRNSCLNLILSLQKHVLAVIMIV